MDNNTETPPAITDSEIIRIVQPELDALEKRLSSDNRAMIVAALSTIPSEDTVKRMIDDQVANARKELLESINSVVGSVNSIDMHLRQAEGSFSEAKKTLGLAVEKFETFVARGESMFASLEERQNSVDKDVLALSTEVATVRNQAGINRIELAQTTDHLNDLKFDVHGDPSKPDMPSLFKAITSTNESVSQLNARVAKYDTIADVLARIWQNKVGKAVIMLMLSAFATDMVYTATKIIQAVLAGGKLP